MTTSRTVSSGGIRSCRATVVSPTRVRSSATSTRPSRSPSTRTVPRVGCSRAAARLSRVVLPAPLGPRTTHRSSSSTRHDTSRSRSVLPRRTVARSMSMTRSGSMSGSADGVTATIQPDTHRPRARRWRGGTSPRWGRPWRCSCRPSRRRPRTRCRPASPTVQACVLAGLLSNSAVPVLAYTGPPGTSRERVAGAGGDHLAHHRLQRLHRGRRSGRGAGRQRGRGLAGRTGRRHR